MVVIGLNTAAHAQKRVALVIGNAGYVEASPLRNPTNDAAALSASLRRLGFEVLTGLDLDLQAMRALVRDFGRQVEGADLALFFYAGHGVQVNGKNYLLPTDANLEDEADLDFSAIEADLVMRQMDRAANTKLVMLDACRNNPFERALSRSMGATRSARSLGRGLARINASGGSMIAFATDPGAVAYDGEGQHSPFTEALLKHIETPGLEVNVLMTRVRADVFGATGTKQRPWTSSSLIGEVYLVPAGAPAPVVVTPAAPAPSDTALEIAMWTAAEKGGGVADYESYLARYPDGAFAGMAGNRIAALAPADEPPASSTTPGGASVAAPTLPPLGAADGASVAAPTLPPLGASGGVSVAAPTLPPLGASDGASAAAPTLPPLAASGGSGVALAPATAGAEAAPVPETAERALNLSGTARREVQERLAALGHDPRGLDGIFGPGTRAAIGAWQDSAGLAATGYLDSNALARLNAASEDKLAAFRAEQKRRAAAASQRRSQGSGQSSGQSSGQRTTGATRTGGMYRARAVCGAITGTGQHSDRQQAMLQAARQCASKGGAPACCTSGVTVSR